jgi:hypothetical protein
LGAPSTATLRRIADLRVSQYWDEERLVSRLLGERDRSSVVWDYIAVYQPGKIWVEAPPEPAFSKNPVVRAIGGTANEIQQMLELATTPPSVQTR